PGHTLHCKVFLGPGWTFPAGTPTITWRFWWSGKEDLLGRASHGRGSRRLAISSRLWNHHDGTHDEFCDEHDRSVGLERVPGPGPATGGRGAEIVPPGGGGGWGYRMPCAVGDGDAAQRTGWRQTAQAVALLDGRGSLWRRS